MISCTEFIPAYSELFKYLEQRGGPAAVLDFWHFLSDNYLADLKKLAEEQGLHGCWQYWSHTLNEEAADFVMELDEEAGELSVVMAWCPSKGRLLACKEIEPYHDYCGHCKVLYRRVLEPLGIECDYDHSEVDQARCSETYRERHGK